MKNLEDFFNLHKDMNSRLVGYVTQINFESLSILSNDFFNNNVNSISPNAFLIVTQHNKENKLTSIFLLRAKQISYIDKASKENKEETIQKIDIANQNKSTSEILNTFHDPFNRNKLSFYQLDCKILGTFFMDNGKINFGSDCYGFSVAEIYRVYKPSCEQLEFIVNFIKEDRLQATYELLEKLSPESEKFNFDKNNNLRISFNVGTVRYTSTQLPEKDQPSKVLIYPTDFIKQKTAVLGMTRTGKSNTIKIIASSIISLSQTAKMKIGQIIYDINGEYANDNDQNDRLIKDKDCLYTIDKDMLSKSQNFSGAINNFYIQTDYGLNIIQNGIRNSENNSNYINTFLSIKNVKANPILYLLWCILLFRSGYSFPNIFKNYEKTFFTDNFNNQYIFKTFEDRKPVIGIKLQNDFFDKLQTNPAYGSSGLSSFINQNKYIIITEEKLSNFNKIINQAGDTNAKTNSNTNSDSKNKFGQLKQFLINYQSEQYLDEISLLSFITMFDLIGNRSISGWLMISPYKTTHYENSFEDYRDTIYNQLKDGKTVIIDFSLGDVNLRQYVADEIMNYIFEKQIQAFKQSSPPIINVFIEEAHNVLGKNSQDNSLWPRVAKEGAKYNIGVIYATQSPSSISDSMLSQTANFVVAHLNNAQEISVITQYEDLADFSRSIKEAQDVGFVRLKLLSKTYSIPVQIKKFENKPMELENTIKDIKDNVEDKKPKIDDTNIKKTVNNFSFIYKKG